VRRLATEYEDGAVDRIGEGDGQDEIPARVRLLCMLQVCVAIGRPPGDVVIDDVIEEQIVQGPILRTSSSLTV
jgi:hypothetical protein